MAELTAQCLCVRCTATRAATGRFVLARDPLDSESGCLIPRSGPAESELTIAASNPTLISRVFAFEFQEGVTEKHARRLAQQMTGLLSHPMYTLL
jgi:hypothetical protein